MKNNNDNLQISTNNGLSYYHQVEDRFINYAIQGGLTGTQLYWNTSRGSSHDLLYPDSVGGLVAIESSHPAMSPPVTKVRLIRLRVNNEEILPGSEYPSEGTAIATRLKLHEGKKSFSFEFAALNFESNNIAIYSYRLIGFDDEWAQVLGNRHFASCTDLPPGSYTL